MFKRAILAIILTFSIQSYGKEKIKVVTTIPDLAEVVKSIGGEHVEVDSLLEGTEDAHFLDASPNFIRKVANADVVCIVGLDLEIGWVPKILSKSGKAQVQPGGTGYCEAGKSIDALEKPTVTVDRSMGDVHPSGNPHYNLSPLALAQAAEIVSQTLIKVSPQYAGDFSKGLKDFKARMESLHAKIKERLKQAIELSKTHPIVVEYHKEFTYFYDTYGINSFRSIEELPGVPPSASRLAEVALGAKAVKVSLAMGAFYSPEKHLKKFTEISTIPYKKLPTMVQKGNSSLDTIEKVQNRLAETILQSI